MRALVTGGAGFAGRHLCAALNAGGHVVEAVGLPGPDGPPDHATWRELDITDAEGCRELLGQAQPDWLFHLAGYAHVSQAESEPDRCLAVNFGGVRTVLDTCLAVSARTKVVLVSSAEVYGHVPPERLPVTEDSPLMPATVYAVSKAAAEMTAHHALARGLQVVILRPFNHIGPGQSDAFMASDFAHQLARIEAGHQDPVMHVGNLEAVRDVCDVRDTVRGYIRAAESGTLGAAYNVTSGRSVSVREILDTLRSLCRVDVSVQQDPERLRPLDMPVFHGSGELLARDTGFRAELDLGRTLADVLDYWRKRETPPS